LALDDTTLVIPGTGFVYLSPVGTARPALAAAPAAPWVDMGHSTEDGLTINYEVSTTVRRTWRARAGVRKTVDEVSFTLGWTGLQVDNDTLAAYFGGGDTSTAAAFGVMKVAAPYERALFIRLVDGGAEVDIYAAKASISAAGEATASPEGFIALPLEAQILDHAAAAHLAQWLAPHLGTSP
jgi:hypothetical protein